jgi:hypothetical protein
MGSLGEYGKGDAAYAPDFSKRLALTYSCLWVSKPSPDTLEVGTIRLAELCCQGPFLGTNLESSDELDKGRQEHEGSDVRDKQCPR